MLKLVTVYGPSPVSILHSVYLQCSYSSSDSMLVSARGPNPVCYFLCLSAVSFTRFVGFLIWPPFRLFQSFILSVHSTVMTLWILLRKTKGCKHGCFSFYSFLKSIWFAWDYRHSHWEGLFLKYTFLLSNSGIPLKVCVHALLCFWKNTLCVDGKEFTNRNGVSGFQDHLVKSLLTISGCVDHMVKNLLTVSGCVDGKEFTDHKWVCWSHGKEFTDRKWVCWW